MTEDVDQNKTKVTFAYNTSLPPSYQNNDAILDSGTTGNYLTVDSAVTNIKPTPNGIQAKIPDGTILQATHQCELRLPNLPPKARVAHVFKEFHNPLLSIALLCDNGCEVIFANTNVTVQHNAKTILTGYRDLHTGLWGVKLDADHPTTNQPSTNLANSIVPTGTIADTMQFLHMACFSPSTSTLIRAIDNGNFATWPMFTCENIKKHLPKSEATALGHLDQQRKNTQSTKRTPTTRSTTTTADTTGIAHAGTHETYTSLLDINSPTGQIHTDQTGRFPIQSSRGNKYVMILHDYNSNAILAEAMTSRAAHEMVRAYEKLHTYLVTRGLKPQLQ
jgi:hypothetical protein